MPSRPDPWDSEGVLARIAGVVLVIAACAVGLWRRLKDPLSTNVLPAEDPFTHMALVRGHLLDGSLDPLYDGGRLYPPGMHAWLATIWAYTGVDLEILFRYAPILVGLMGILCLSALLWHYAGPAAAAIGAWVAALAPELIFRSIMMSPTAVDLVLVPVFLYTLVELLRGRLAWVAGLAATSTFLVFSHPWLLAILAPTTLGIIVAWMVLGRGPAHAWRLRSMGAALALLVIAAALMASVASCWSQCTASWRHLLPADRIDTLALAGAAACLLVAFVIVALHRRLDAAMARRDTHWAWPTAAVALLVAAAYWGSPPAFEAGLPKHVNLPNMIGTPLLALAGLGLVLMPWRPNPAALAGAALAIVTYPFVIYNPFDSPFWPHRTVVYLAIATALLAGSGAATVLHGAMAMVRRIAVRSSGTRRGVISTAAMCQVGVLLLVAGGVHAEAPQTYTWYRLYDACEYEALQEIAEDASARAIVITGDWRPKLVMAAYAHEGRNVWYSEPVFTDPAHRNETLVGMATWAPRVIIVIDDHTRSLPGYNMTLEAEGWQHRVHDCADQEIEVHEISFKKKR